MENICSSLTQKKLQCSKRTINGSKYCNLHLPVKIEFISDRQDLLKKLRFEPYCIDDLSMYVIKICSKGEIILYTVSPFYNKHNCFSYAISHQSGNYTNESYNLAKETFLGSKEEDNIKRWAKLLYDGGYYEHR
jgi:hypothetical protein